MGDVRASEDRVDSLLAAMSAAISAWEVATVRLAAAKRWRQLELRRAQRQLRVARGGLHARRWKQMTARRSSVRSKGHAQDINRALRRQAPVQLAEMRLAEVEFATGEAVAVAIEALAHAAGGLLVYGGLAGRVTGWSTRDLERLARGLGGECLGRQAHDA